MAGRPASVTVKELTPRVRAGHPLTSALGLLDLLLAWFLTFLFIILRTT